MSRIGKHPVTIPAGVTLTQDGQSITVKGPKGELNFVLPNVITGKLEGAEFSVKPNDDSKEGKAMWGMSRSMVANLVEGVTNGFQKNFGTPRCWLSCANERLRSYIATRLLP